MNISPEGPEKANQISSTNPSNLSRLLEKIYPYQLPAAFARTQLESLSALEIDSQPYNYRLTSIISTLGPNTREVEVLEKMMEAGCGVLRLNLSHGSYEDHLQMIENIKTAASKHWLPICLAIDTKGPEIRTGILKAGMEETIEIATGSMVTITIDDSVKEACDDHNIWVDYKSILNVLDVGKRLVIDTDALSLIVREKGPYYLKCEVEHGGTLGSQKNVCLPGTDVDLPAVSEKDVQDISFGMENGVDVIFASFIKNADSVRNIRKIMGDKGKKIKIFSKIECREGVKKFNEILEASDGIIISRGKLGVEIPVEKVFLVQKMLTSRTLRAGKSVICSSQMLSNMMKNPRPTRAEVTDVANSVMDGVDGLLLANETSLGQFSVNCIETIHKVAREAECAMYHRQLFEELRLLTPKPVDVSKAASISAVEASIECMAVLILVLTYTGKSAICISSYRPRCPVIAVTRDETTSKQLRLVRGILPLWFKGPKASPYEKDVDVRIQFALKMAEQKGLLNVNNFVVIVHGSRAGSSSTDSVRIIQYSRK